MKQTLDSLTASNSLLPEKMVMEKESSGLPVFASFLVRGTAVRLFPGAFKRCWFEENILSTPRSPVNQTKWLVFKDKPCEGFPVLLKSCHYHNLPTFSGCCTQLFLTSHLNNGIISRHQITLILKKIMPKIMPPK